MKHFFRGMLACLLIPFWASSQNATTTFSPSLRQGIKYDYWSGATGGGYSYTQYAFADEVEESGDYLSATEQYARYQFNHPSFPNSSIVSIRLIANISDIDSWNGSGNSGASVLFPDQTCNAYSWNTSTSTTLASIKNCIKNSGPANQYSIGTNGSSISVNHLIHDVNLIGHDHSGLFNPTSYSTVIALKPLKSSGSSTTLKINSIQIQITYIAPPISNNTICCTQAVASGASVSLTGTTPTGGTGTYAYTWYRSLNGVDGWSAVASSANYSFTANGGYFYKRVVTSGSFSSTSNIIQVSQNGPIGNNVLSDWQFLYCNNSYFDPAQIVGSNPTGGNGTYTYQWYYSVDGGTVWNFISGATSKNYDPPPITTNNAALPSRIYRRVVTSGSYTNSSGTTSVEFIYPDPIANNTITTTQGSSYFECSNSVDLSVIQGSLPTGGGAGVTYNYQWFYSQDGGANYNPISNSNTQSIDPPAFDKPTIVYRMVSVNNCNLPNNGNVVYIYPSPSLNLIGQDQSYTTCTADPETILNVSLTSNGPIYFKWQSSLDNANWSDISNASTSRYDPGVINSTTYYKRLVRATSDCPFVESNVVAVTISPASTNVTLNAPSTLRCSGTPMTLTASTAQPGGTYDWYKDGTLVGNSTNGQWVSDQSSGTYYTVVNNTCGSFTSNSISLTAVSSPVVDFLNVPSEICHQQKMSLVPTVSGIGGYSYLWTSDHLQGFSCTNCYSPTFYSTYTGSLGVNSTLQVTDANGCVTSKNLYFSVNAKNPAINNNEQMCGNIYGSEYISAYQTISAGGSNCGSGYNEIRSGADVVYRANEKIELHPGFETESNARFIASINIPCADLALRTGLDSTNNENAESKLIYIYPNPSEGRFNVQISGVISENIQLTILDPMGKNCLESTWESNAYDLLELDLSKLPNGIYTLQTMIGDEQIIKRIVIQK